jgi:hypothetical protein
MDFAYVSVETLKGSGVLDIIGTTEDTALRRLAEAVSEQVNHVTNRHFSVTQETRTFDGPGGTRLNVPQLISVGTLAEDQQQSGTWDVIWGSNDYVLYPNDVNPTNQDGRPHFAIDVSAKSNGSQDSFGAGQRKYQVTGRFGYMDVTYTIPNSVFSTVIVGTLADAVTTTLELANGTSGVIEVGWTIDLASGTKREQVYVTNILGGTATSVQVVRGVNGSTATAFTGDALNVYEYPGPITEAVIIQVGRVWNRRQNSFASSVAFPNGGGLQFSRLDPDVASMLSHYRRPSFGGR